VWWTWITPLLAPLRSPSEKQFLIISGAPMRGICFGSFVAEMPLPLASSSAFKAGRYVFSVASPPASSFLTANRYSEIALMAAECSGKLCAGQSFFPCSAQVSDRAGSRPQVSESGGDLRSMTCEVWRPSHNSETPCSAQVSDRAGSRPQVSESGGRPSVNDVRGLETFAQQRNGGLGLKSA